MKEIASESTLDCGLEDLDGEGGKPAICKSKYQLAGENCIPPTLGRDIEGNPKVMSHESKLREDTKLGMPFKFWK